MSIFEDPKFHIQSLNHWINHVKSSLTNWFEILDLGLHYFLGLQIQQSDKGIFVSQPKLSLKLLHRFHMEYYFSSNSKLFL
jgi:hypothetical protein